MQINFWLAVLSIDIRRFMVGSRKKIEEQGNSDREERVLKVPLPTTMPHSINRRQQPQPSQWLRYRVLQRGSMFLVLIWVLLIFYKWRIFLRS